MLIQSVENMNHIPALSFLPNPSSIPTFDETHGFIRKDFGIAIYATEPDTEN